MPADFVAIVAIVGVVTLARAWHVVAAYRSALHRLRRRRKLRSEAELFERLERSMQSDRVE